MSHLVFGGDGSLILADGQGGVSHISPSPERKLTAAVPPRAGVLSNGDALTEACVGFAHGVYMFRDVNEAADSGNEEGELALTRAWKRYAAPACKVLAY